MQLYQFEKIYSQMEREFGKIRKGEEANIRYVAAANGGNCIKNTPRISGIKQP